MKKVFSALAVVLILLIAALAYLGAFRNVELNEAMTGPYHVVYQQYTGDYSKMGTIMDKIYEDFLAQGWEIGSSIGIFYDDPQSVPTDELRSDLGIVVKSRDLENIGELSGTYLTQTLSQANRLLATFPNKNQMSFVVGVFKVYPVMNEYLEEHNYAYDVPRIEMYDENKIIYLVELIER